MLRRRRFFTLAALIVSAYSLPLLAETSSLMCQGEALKDARSLLGFYNNNDPRVAIENKVTPLSVLTNPANTTQHFDVLEVWGFVYKGKYRMRLIYSPQVHCLRMGEEILEYASL
ncbi:hypothetical protein QMA77_23410 [Pantoea ananatis]|uniref:hypothetical protein n=1 Tax=Pantoea ananas TaxID=553 RepID=UPI0024AD4045|nr:hypothetical protein [Pantoea ananatis]MDI6539865.1 hypothetical protein [Pantoea ananatis]